MASPFDDAALGKAVASADMPAEPTVLPQPVAHKGLSKPLMGAMLAGTVADGVTTNAALAHGWRETNPFLSQNRGWNAAGIGLSGLGIALLTNEIAKSHPTLGKLLAAGSIGTSTVDSIINLHGGLKSPPGFKPRQ